MRRRPVDRAGIFPLKSEGIVAMFTHGKGFVRPPQPKTTQCASGTAIWGDGVWRVSWFFFGKMFI